MKKLLKAHEYEILQNKVWRDELEKHYLSNTSASDMKYNPPPIAKIINCFEICDAILEGEETLDNRRSDLEDLCFDDNTWKVRLAELGDDQKLNEKFLRNMKWECSRILHKQPEYKTFKAKLIEEMESWKNAKNDNPKTKLQTQLTKESETA